MDINSYNENGSQEIICEVCPKHCALSKGQVGFCKARKWHDGNVISKNYGRITSMALDPIEKKPLYHFHPGSMILSVGSYGCNMNCFYCQNHEISQKDESVGYTHFMPEELVAEALKYSEQGSIGIAFTYNEPAIGWEFVRDTATLANLKGLLNVMVTNGCFCEDGLHRLLPAIDAFNIDLKCFTEDGYKALGGDFSAVKNTIEIASAVKHVEISTLIVPGQNDDEDQMESQSAWLASLSPDIPLHIARYFPRWKAEMPQTSEDVMRRLEKVAKRHLKNVHLGNIRHKS